MKLACYPAKKKTPNKIIVLAMRLLLISSLILIFFNLFFYFLNVKSPNLVWSKENVGFCCFLLTSANLEKKRVEIKKLTNKILT